VRALRGHEHKAVSASRMIVDRPAFSAPRERSDGPASVQVVHPRPRSPVTAAVPMVRQSRGAPPGPPSARRGRTSVGAGRSKESRASNGEHKSGRYVSPSCTFNAAASLHPPEVTHYTRVTARCRAVSVSSCETCRGAQRQVDATLISARPVWGGDVSPPGQLPYRNPAISPIITKLREMFAIRRSYESRSSTR
jgi:hypothetical protein